ncbi:E3 ubiquitin-protein ligase RNF180 [Lethenteron reissneri]|uniref:E3 ubiquitin-protein ligase RNF180 n=1 Tax=Lethenteron reissneri TaxID=7753 RepID=UPI002AB7AEFE|nr:E3 ubiquitin-protein ligase RNF180 [Lethenteron reissneri]
MSCRDTSLQLSAPIVIRPITLIIQDMRRHPVVQTAILRCWKCRRPLMDSSNLLSSHGEQLNPRDCEGKCEREDESSIWYINQENVPSWLTTEMDRGQWTKGKLHCPHCGGRLGSFNFVIPSRCLCGEYMVPAVQICKSRVDYELTSPPNSIDAQSKPDFIRRDLCPAVKDPLTEPPQSLPSKTSLEACLQRSLCMPQTEQGKAERCTIEKILQASVPATGPPPTHVVRRHRKCFSLDLRNSGGSPPAVYSPLAYRRSRSATAVWGKREIGSSPCMSSLLAHFHREPADGERSAILEDDQENTHTRRTLSCSAMCGVTGSLRNRARNDDDDGMTLRRSDGADGTVGSASGVAARMLFSDSSSGSGSESDCEDEAQPSVALERPRLPLEFQRNREFLEADAEERVQSEERSRMKRVGRNRRKGDRWLQKKQDTDRGKRAQRDGDTAEESEGDAEMEGHTCAVCLDVYCSPYLCHPCRHVFCETCLRSLARDNPGSTPCPLCRVLIRRVTYQPALDDAAKLLFPRAYVARKRSDLRLHGPDWPLPGRQGGLRTIMASLRGASGRPGTQLRWHLPHAFRLDEDEEQSRGWLDMDRIIIYVYSINWLIGFVTFCCFCYLLFTSIF